MVFGDVDAEVRYSVDGGHLARVTVGSKDGEDSPYKFSLTAIASFSFDLDVAKREYRGVGTRGLVPMIAVNVSRILYASAREYLSMITARAPHGSAVLDSVLLEPSDVRIDAELDPPELIQTLFGATDEEVEEFRALLDKGSATDSRLGAERKKTQRTSKGASGTGA